MNSCCGIPGDTRAMFRSEIRFSVSKGRFPDAEDCQGFKAKPRSFFVKPSGPGFASTV